MTNTTTPKPACIAQRHITEVGIYVASFHCDTSGHQHGAWIDLEDAINEDDIQEGIDWILATSPVPGADEWAVVNSSGLPNYLSNTERPDLSELMRWADGLSACADEDEREAYLLECEKRGHTINNNNRFSDFQWIYCGCYKSEEDFVIKLAEEHLSIDINQINWLFNSNNFKIFQYL